MVVPYTRIMSFTDRYKQLNAKQRQAVDTIDGPLLVLAGPGTGKTELLSMRAANILHKTDTLPSSILCLTFTDSGSAAMQRRLIDIIGTDAYKVVIHTFHAFAAEIMSQETEYFYHGADFLLADELRQYEVLRSIMSELEYTNPLAGVHGDEYTYLKAIKQSITDLKNSGLTSDELRNIIDANEAVMDAIESDIAAIFQNRISKSTVHLLAPVAQAAAAVEQPDLPSAITPYANTVALSIAHAVDEAVTNDSTKPITHWKSMWCEKNDHGEIVFKDRRRHTKLRAVAGIYFEYINRMHEAKLYDYDDMILSVIHAIETQPALRSNLQEKYQYIMVDEFQDTNLAQLRLLFDLTGDETAPNIMAVGDDDQAIYSFQGADIGNIQRFRTHYDNAPVIVLTDNYRSNGSILTAARSVIVQGEDRLETTNPDITKVLTSHIDSSSANVDLLEYPDYSSEYSGVAQRIAEQIKTGAHPESITVIARKHQELIDFVPYLTDQSIEANYEHRENALDHEVVGLIEQLCKVLVYLHDGLHEEADSLLPELISHPAWDFTASDIYRLSITAHRKRSLWLETMQLDPVFQSFADWIIDRTATLSYEAFEQQIDTLIGNPANDRDGTVYISPIYGYYFSSTQLSENSDNYLHALEAFRTLRDRLREYTNHKALTIQSFLDFLTIHRQLNTPVSIVRKRVERGSNRINLMTVHKSKGLEFDTVYIIGSVDSVWGESVRTRPRLISYPANLPIGFIGDTYDERLRLFYVGMTRAKHSLIISYYIKTRTDKAMLPASFLDDTPLVVTRDTRAINITQEIVREEIDWRGRLTNSITFDMRQLLAPTLETYKLSATHLNNFIDVTKGGPHNFLLTNLLRFPQAKSASAGYGTAIHATLQHAHDYLRAHQEYRPLEDVLGDFERKLRDQHLSSDDFSMFYNRGIDALSAYLSVKYDTFTTTQRTELQFGGQSVVLGEARLTGALDLVEIDTQNSTLFVTDYKTGRPSQSWNGKTEYEKIKLHKYRQQLMFYQLLCESSRDYAKYRFIGGELQFVEPTRSGDIISLQQTFTIDEITEFGRLIQAVWHSVMTLELPDISHYEPTLSGIRAFEHDLIDKYTM